MNSTPAPRQVRILVTVDLDPDDDTTPEQIRDEVRAALARSVPADVDLVPADD